MLLLVYSKVHRALPCHVMYMGHHHHYAINDLLDPWSVVMLKHSG